MHKDLQNAIAFITSPDHSHANANLRMCLVPRHSATDRGVEVVEIRRARSCGPIEADTNLHTIAPRPLQCRPHSPSAMGNRMAYHATACTLYLPLGQKRKFGFNHQMRFTSRRSSKGTASVPHLLQHQRSSRHRVLYLRGATRVVQASITCLELDNCGMATIAKG